MTIAEKNNIELTQKKQSQNFFFLKKDRFLNRFF